MKNVMRYLPLILVLLVIVSLNTGCAPKETTTPITTVTTTTTTKAVTTTPTSTTTAYKDINAKEASELIQKNSGNTNFVVLDVRTPDEFKSGHIKDAVNIDVNAVNFEQEVARLDKSKIYLVYCRSGRRSLDASETMLRLGFTSIYNMTGGILEWQAEGYPVVQ